MKKVHCAECVHALTSDKNNENSIVIQIKSQSQLQYLSFSVTKICHAAESVVRFALAEAESGRQSLLTITYKYYW